MSDPQATPDHPFSEHEISLLAAAVFEMKRKYPDDPDWGLLLKRLVALGTDRRR